MDAGDDDDGSPAYQPEASSEKREEEVPAVIGIVPLEELDMIAAITEGAHTIGVGRARTDPTRLDLLLRVRMRPALLHGTSHLDSYASETMCSRTA